MFNIFVSFPFTYNFLTISGYNILDTRTGSVFAFLSNNSAKFLKFVFFSGSNLKVYAIDSSDIYFSALLKIFKSDFEFLDIRAYKNVGSTGLLNNFYRIVGSESIYFNLTGSMFYAFLNKLIRFY